MIKFVEDNLNQILKETFSQSNQSIYILDIEGDILFANNDALDNLGYDLKQIQQLKAWDIDVNTPNKEKFLDSIKFLKNNDNNLTTGLYQTSHKKKNSEVFPVEVSIKFLTIKNKEFMIAYAKNISNRLKRTEKLNLYFELIDSSNDMIFLIDKENESIEFANSIVCSKLGYSLEELKNIKITDLRKPFEGSLKIETSEVFKQLEEKKSLITFGIYICKDGTEVPVETSLQQKTYLDRKFITAISRDIRERIEIEEKKEDLNNKLKEYNRTLHKEISKVKKELITYETMMKKQSKMAAMGEMIENIAHQWRQPLSAVSVLSSGMIIQNEQGVLDKELLTSGLNTISDQVQYLSKTIDDFRNFFKPDKEKNRFKIVDLVNNAIKLIKSRYTKLSIEFIIKLDKVELYSYENELLQVVLNIINNSVDELSKKRYKKAIFISSFIEEQFLVLEIKDNGGGIEKKIIDRIFEPYFTTKHNYHGTGIGLYMSENIMKHLNGKIEVNNEQIEYNNTRYKAACFYLKIPLIKENHE